MDEITKKIIDTQSKIVAVLNESGLHPMVLSLIISQVQSQLQAALTVPVDSKAEDEK